MSNMHSKPLLISIEEAARILDLKPATIYNEISKARHGKQTFLKVKPVKVGGKLIKFRMSDIEAYIRNLPEA